MTKFEKIFPCKQLTKYIKYFVISESEVENDYKVFPTSGLVIGFQYKGTLRTLQGLQETRLATAGITGLLDSYRVFRNSAGVGTILVYFTETGLLHFTAHPANELFNHSISLEYIFQPASIREAEEKLAAAPTDKARISVVEQFFLSQLKEREQDRLVIEAVKLIYASRGSIKIRELSQKLFISQSPLEKRFRKLVGTSPKKFSSIVRFNAVLGNMDRSRSLVDICYENNFFDQAHFIKDFKKFTGDTPESFKRLLW